jgi:arylsulfatase A-like enzyme
MSGAAGAVAPFLEPGGGRGLDAAMLESMQGTSASAARGSAGLRGTLLGIALHGACLGALGCDGPPGDAPAEPGVWRLARHCRPRLSALDRELQPRPEHRLHLRRSAGEARIEVRETWGADALSPTPLPGVWSARPSVTLSLAARQLAREVRVDGVRFEPVVAEVAARALQGGATPPANSFAQLKGELLLACDESAPPGEVELRYRLPLGDFAAGHWRLAFPSFAGDGWLLVPDDEGACGSVEAPHSATLAGRLTLRVKDLSRPVGHERPARLHLRTDAGSTTAIELPAFDAEAPWVEVDWSPKAPWTRFEFHLEGSPAAALLDARWMPAEATASGNRPDVLVFLADTFRADLMRAYRGAPAGDDLDVTPQLDRWAAEQTLFRRSWSVSSWTLPAQASLLSGTAPHSHGAIASNRAVDDTTPFLASVFANAGYRCTAITDGLFLAPKYGLDAHFEWFDARAHRGEVDRRVGAAWDDKDPRPRFSYVQTYRAHAPYTASSATRAEFADALNPARNDGDGRAALDMRAAELEAAGRGLDANDPTLITAMERLRHLYVVGARDLDRMFARVRASFTAGAADPEQVVVVFTSDHGEAFGEHGVMDHGRAVFEHQVRVPLVIQAPDWDPGVREDAAQTLDLAPTLAALAGLEPDPRWTGRDLAAPAESERAVWTWQANGALEPQARGRILGDLKVLRSSPGSPPRIYDLERDPLERAPVDPTAPAAAHALAEFEAEEAEGLRLRPGAGRGLKLTGADRQALEAMGYLSPAAER